MTSYVDNHRGVTNFFDDSVDENSVVYNKPVYEDDADLRMLKRNKRKQNTFVLEQKKKIVYNLPKFSDLVVSVSEEL